MNDALHRVLDLDLRSLPRTDDGAWTTRGLRKSGHDYDEVDCQVAVADFLAVHQERDDFAE